ncbi:MAG TPA: glycosyltransferase family 39 protein, partial [Phycisphaerae bacterium]|nr:glycosyltransferase family 39 protein [Phycisphaerae bacterium]
MQTVLVAHPASNVARRATRLRRRIAIATFLIAITGGALRVMTVTRPLNHQLANSWREADYVQIARNFDREGMNILYPRIDWRGDTPGFVEMELPLTPWLAAAGYRVFGYHEQLLRILSAAFSLFGMLLFYAIARDALSRVGALIAFAAFAFNPLLVRLSGAMQPEPLMIACIVLTAYHAFRFDRKGRAKSLLLAAAATALAGLAKAPGVYVGAILAYACLRRFGWRALLKPIVWLSAAIAILPVFLWYDWAAHFWREYGNSLGLSNESHWITWRLLWPPDFLRGNLITEFFLVWSPVGWVLGIVALNRARRRRALTIASIWYTTTWVFYIAAAGTSSNLWTSRGDGS